MLFAERILDRPDIINGLIKKEKDGKDFLIGELKSRGYWYMDCHGNYVLIRPKHDAHLVARRLAEEKKTLVHPYGNTILKDLLRVTVGSVDAMKIFAVAFFEVDS